MKIAVLDRNALGQDLSVEPLRAFGDVCVYDTTVATQVSAHIGDADVIVVNKVKITADAIRQAPALRLICEFATGYDNIDLTAAREAGVAVCNVPGYSTESVTLFTVATVLALYTHLREYNEVVVSGEYTAGGAPNRLSPAYHELSGKTWGIVGYGNIGKRVGAVAGALGAVVLVNKRTPDPTCRCVDLDTLARESDIITLHCPLTDQTRHMIGAHFLSLMKADAVLVNEARGAVTDEAAVARAIEEGRLGAFGSDVYSEEPLTGTHPLYAVRDRKNVLLTPHAAWGAIEARVRCLSVICENIRSFLSGGQSNRVV